MPCRPHRRFSALFAAGPGAHVRAGARGLSYIEKVDFWQHCTADDLRDICRWSGLAHPRMAGISRAAFGRLLRVAAQRRPTNHYHHAGHFAHVIIAAGLLGKMARLSAHQNAVLVLAALVHDLDHAGRYARQDTFAQELISARRAARLIAGAGGDARLSLRLTLLLKATALTIHDDRKAILASDKLARLLADADLFSSLFSSRKTAIRMTHSLMLETMQMGHPAEQYDRFICSMMRVGPHSAAGRSLLQQRLGKQGLPWQNDPEKAAL